MKAVRKRVLVPLKLKADQHPRRFSGFGMCDSAQTGALLVAIFSLNL